MPCTTFLHRLRRLAGAASASCSFRGAFSRRSFLLPPTLFLVQRLLRFLRRRGLSGSPGFFLCPSCLPGTLCTLSFPACICTCLMPPTFPMYLRFLLFHKIQPPADCFSHFTFLLSHSVYPNSGKKQRFPKIFARMFYFLFRFSLKSVFVIRSVHLFLVSSNRSPGSAMQALPGSRRIHRSVPPGPPPRQPGPFPDLCHHLRIEHQAPEALIGDLTVSGHKA